jgi:hypothetical protein
MARCWCQVMLAMTLSWLFGCDTMYMPSHAGDNVTKLCWWRLYWFLLTALLRRHWSWHNVVAESCWWRCCRVMLVMVLLSPADDSATESCWWWCCRDDVGHDAMSMRLGCGTMSLPSHSSDDAAETTWSWCDVSNESCCATGVGIFDRSCDVRPELGYTYIISIYNG